jgi:hypothetical protein
MTASKRAFFITACILTHSYLEMGLRAAEQRIQRLSTCGIL